MMTLTVDGGQVSGQESLSDVEADSDLEEFVIRRRKRRANSETRLANIANDLFLSQSCVYLLRHPSVFNFSRLRRKLESEDNRWMDEFLHHNGIELLFECLGDLGRYTGTFSNLVLRLECVLCIRTVMNSKTGLRCLVSSSNTYGANFSGGNTNILYFIYCYVICLVSISTLCNFSRNVWDVK
jgi:hypothetical protein